MRSPSKQKDWHQGTHEASAVYSIVVGSTGVGVLEFCSGQAVHDQCSQRVRRHHVPRIRRWEVIDRQPLTPGPCCEVMNTNAHHARLGKRRNQQAGRRNMLSDMKSGLNRQVKWLSSRMEVQQRRSIWCQNHTSMFACIQSLTQSSPKYHHGSEPAHKKSAPLLATLALALCSYLRSKF